MNEIDLLRKQVAELTKIVFSIYLELYDVKYCYPDYEKERQIRELLQQLENPNAKT
jgi:hypothetical protein